MVKDISVCIVSDDEESGEKRIEKLLTEKIPSGECNFVASKEEEFEKHCDVLHGEKPGSTLNEDVAYVPPVKPLPLYKCSECSFTTTTTGTLREAFKKKNGK